MTKDAAGVWSVTTAPLEPELWTYTFSLNGTTMLDPANPKVMRNTTQYANALLVSGPATAVLETGTVPHGTVSAVWYPSTALKANRRMLVYTPPGYEDSRTRYPVLYLFHGGGGDEEQWNNMGKATTIMDNVIAQGRAKPMIVVMPNAIWNQTAALERTPPPAGGGAPAGQDYARAEAETVQDIIPFVERRYRTLTDRANRAIAGLSMGGGIAINVGLKRLDVFASVGQFSSGMFGGTGGGYGAYDIEKISPGFLKDPAATNKKLAVLFFSCGAEDPRMPFTVKAVEQLKNAKINLVFKEYPGAHEWKVWQKSLADFTPMLFASR
jgi:enterochelin esterase family protein